MSDSGHIEREAAHEQRPSGEAPDGGPTLKKWWDEFAAFRSVEGELVKDERYADKHVAFRDGRVIDSDADEFRLARRVGRQHPGTAVLIVKVGAELPRLGLPFPELRG